MLDTTIGTQQVMGIPTNIPLSLETFAGRPDTLVVADMSRL